MGVMAVAAYDILTIDEAAIVIKVSPRRVRQFCEAGRLGQRFGDRWAIPKGEAEEFAKRERPTGRPLED